MYMYTIMIVCCLKILVISGAVEHGNHYTLNLVYEHILERTAYNMTYGPFGGVRSKSSVTMLLLPINFRSNHLTLSTYTM